MASPTSSPRWDNRDSGFLGPSQLQQWKQQQALQQQQLQEQQRALQQQQQDVPAPSAPEISQQPQPSMFRTTSKHDQQPMATPPSAQTHSRTTSAFSFFKRPSHNSSLSTQSLKEPQRQSTIPDEFGQQQTATGPPHASMANKSPPPLPPGQSSQRPISTAPQQMPSDDSDRVDGPPTSLSNAPPASQSQEAPAMPVLHSEIRSIVQLNIAHGQKIYFSGPLIRRFERQADGQRPTKDEGWRDVWAQLGGTTLSLWDMKAIEEASKQGKQVPPSYVNVTDAFIQVLGSVTVPATATAPAKKYTNVLALNNAGTNLYLFSCPSTQALLSWTAALRLAAWEKSRLEEIYTAHLLRITLNDGRDAPTPLSQGKLEGWVRIRVAGQTDWKRQWMVVTVGSNFQEGGSVSSADPGASLLRKKRLSNLFSSGREDPIAPRPSPQRPLIQLFPSNKPKDKKKALLTVRDVRQAFAVYPERPEFISRSTLFKLEGHLGDEDLAAGFKNKEGWLLVMPELEGLHTRASEMLKWIIGIHDAFELYGRPRLYSWDPRDPRSMMFAYPIGPHKDMLFLDRELAENLDPTDEQTSSIRAQLLHIMWDRMRGSPGQSQSPPVTTRDGPPVLPPLRDNSPENRLSPSPGDSQVMQIPPLNFEASRVDQDLPAVPPRSLTPITERSGDPNSRFSSTEHMNGMLTGRTGPSPPSEQTAEAQPGNHVVAANTTSSPTEMRPLSPATTTTQPSIYPSTESAADSRGPSSMDSALASAPKPEPKPTYSRQGTATSIQFNSLNAANAPRLLETGRHSPAVPQDQRSPAVSFRAVPSAPQASAPVSPSTASMRSSGDSPSQAVPPRFTAFNTSQSAAEVQPLASPGISHAVPQSPPPTSSPRFSVLTSPHSVDEPVERRSGSRLSMSMQDSTPQLATPRPVAHSSVPPSPLAAHREMRSTISPRLDAALPSPGSQSASSPSMPSTPPITSPSMTFVAPTRTAEIRQPSPAPGPSPPPPPKDPSSDISGEAGALYYMRNLEQTRKPHRQLPPSPGTDSDESESGSAYSPSPAGTQQPAISPASTTSANSPNAFTPTPGGYFTPRASVAYSSPLLNQGNMPGPPSRATEAPPSAFSPRAANMPPSRKPSGARAAPVNKTLTAQRDHQQPPPLPPHEDEDEDEDEKMSEEQYSEEIARGPRQLPPRMAAVAAQHDESDAADALAALSFLEREEHEQHPPPPSHSFLSSPPPTYGPEIVEPRTTSPPASNEGSIRSSFAKSKQATQRKAQSEAQKAAQHAATHVPGRANGKRKKVRDAGAWGESSDEEEEEEEEEEEDADSDAEPPQKPTGRMEQRHPGLAGQQGHFPARSTSPIAPQEQTGYPTPSRRPPRDLPQLPQGPSHSQLGAGDYLGPQPHRFVSDQYSEAGRRSLYPDAPRQQTSQTQMRQPEYNNVGAARHNMWSQALERDTSAAAPEPARDTFVQIEPPSQTMTKAFAPHGLLSAGLQDKQDRSAKRQEELARESGASLINVAHKPPPPQTGLLGAVTAHERERKREGGLGAALTEREREKRLAEERQRKLDEYQRMQLEQMQQGGTMYGGMGMQPQFSGFNPMMNPMMMGMNPMMTGGYMGFPGMMNPQHMFAAQQAAQAYQQAMYAFSTAGSQVGGEGGSPGAAMNPMMTGNGMGLDPRMSMMGMGMLSPSMTGMGQGMMSPGMGPMGMGGMGGMGMGPQMTGGSMFDPRYPSGNEAPQALNEVTGPPRPYSQNSNGQGSPAGPRPVDGSEEPARRGADVR